MAMRTFSFLLALVAVCFLHVSSDAQAIMLGAYDFENASGVASVDSDANSTAGLITDGGGLSSNANASRGETNVGPFVAGTNDQSYGFAQTNAIEASAAAARTNLDYFYFTVTANSGYRLDLNDLSFRAALSNSAGVSRNWTLDYSINGQAFVNNFDSGTFTGPLTTAINTPVWTPFTVDLSSPLFDGISSITLRLVQDGTSTDLHSIFYDKIALNGITVEAPVPEPSSIALLAIGGLGVIRCARRRARNARSAA